ncbi:MAG TPA: L-threonylcarbamoyladenylate synthase [Gaiellaceae bacterium]
MQTIAHPSDPGQAAEAVAAALEAGGVAVIPTDTVYGLAGLPARPEAVQRIFELKQRPLERRLPVIVAAAEGLGALGIELGPAGERVAAAFWPGALTIVAGVREPAVEWLQGRDEVGVRVPAAPVAIRLAELVGPFLMTSANMHGGGTRSTLAEVLADLAGEPDVAVDGGELSIVSSTLVNVNLAEPAIEREGAVPSEIVMAALRG